MRGERAVGKSHILRRVCVWLLVACLGGTILHAKAGAANAQSADFARLNSLYVRSKAAGQWDQAAAAAEALRQVIRRDGLPLAVDIAAVDLLALARANQSRFDEALALYRQNAASVEQVRPASEDQARVMRTLRFNSLNGAARMLHLLGRLEQASAAFERAIDYASRAGLTTEEAIARVDSTRVLNDLGLTERREQVLLETLPRLERAAREERPRGHVNSSYANALRGLATINEDRGRFDLAESYHRQAIDVCVRTYGWNHNFTAIMCGGLAVSLARQDRQAEAERMFRIAIGVYERTIGRESNDCATAIENLARVVDNLGRGDEAERLGREALAINQRIFGDNHIEVARSMFDLAIILANAQKNDEAESLIDRYIELETQVEGREGPSVVEAKQLRVSIDLVRGDYQRVLDVSDELLAAHRRRPFSPGRVAALHTLRAVSLHKLGRVDEAAAEMEKAIEQAELQRAHIGGAERERATYFEGMATYYGNAITYQAELGDVTRMFELIEETKARTFLDELELRRGDFLARLPDTERKALVAREAELRQKLSAAEAAYDALDGGANAARDRAASAVLAAREALYQHLTDVRSASAVYRDLLTRDSQTTSLADLQDSLADGQVMLDYAIGPERSYVVVVRRDDAQFAELNIDDTTAEALRIAAGPLTGDRVKEALQAQEGGLLMALSSPAPLQEHTLRQLAALYTLLVPARERAAIAAGEIKGLTILPDGALSLLPFEALIVSRASAPRYLLDVAPPISYAPSASVWLNLNHRAPRSFASREAVLTLGDPTYSSAADPQDVASRELRGLDAAGNFRSRLTRLPYSGWEAAWIKQHFDQAGMPAVLLKGAEATEGAVRRLSRDKQIIHLACHGLADDAYGNLFGALALATGQPNDANDDGNLSMSEIHSLDLSACELAILSACQTNFGPSQQGEGVWALSRAFLVAGARRVVASDWVVDDEAGATLVSYFGHAVAKSHAEGEAIDYARSLLAAKRLVRNDPRWQHPFYWSSLVLVGPS